MIFANPTFLYALGFLAVPIIIHFFSFRIPKKIVFTNLELLKEIKEEKKSIQRIKNWLLLILRCLALACIILAFAEPTLPASQDQAGNLPIAIYIDNSFSVSEGNIEDNKLQLAKNLALDVIREFPSTQKFIVSDNCSEFPRELGGTEASDYINGISPCAKVGSWDKITDIQTKNPQLQSLFVFSDFQKSTFSSDVDFTDSTTVYLNKLGKNPTPNLSVDSIAINTPTILVNNEFAMEVFISNHSGEAIENLPVYISLDGKSKAPVSISIEAGATNAARFQMIIPKAGIVKGKVYINDNPVVFDNNLFFTLNVEQTKRITFLGAEKSKPIEALFNEDPEFIYQSVNPKQIDLNIFEDYEQTIIIGGISEISSGVQKALQQFVFSGGVLIVAPNANSDFNAFKQLVENLQLGSASEMSAQGLEVSKLNLRSSFLQSLFKASPDRIKPISVKSHYRFNPNFSGEVLLSAENNEVVLSQHPIGAGNIFVFPFNISPENSNFPNHGLFAPLFLKATQYAGGNKPSYYNIGKDKEVLINIPAEIIGDLTIVNGDQALIPAYQKTGRKVKVFLDRLPLMSGHYELKDQEKVLGQFSMNLNRVESQLAHYSEAELKEITFDNNWIKILEFDAAQKSVAITESLQLKDYPLWPIFIGLGILFLLTEMLWIRWQNRQLSK
ncbi:BatA domain-containing protein [Luteibaculum oceani]|uniref:Aerotolerance regulator N-terminal domain-containing protein n=1 Tax=Luteibaculum oceani TaxID=1294296 RepID=A0A5C6V1U6_9FLAO|nr:BatA domain-containing protein [Luteibaculum oceani]TXC78661.1 hypothetical protein FRX97_08055 [Luteibaculum oceani]